MKKLGLAIGLGAFIVFGASAGSLAAYRVDNTAGVAGNRESRIWSETATNARLLFLNEALYPETVAAGATSPGAHGNQGADVRHFSVCRSLSGNADIVKQDIADLRPEEAALLALLHKRLGKELKKPEVKESRRKAKEAA